VRSGPEPSTSQGVILPTGQSGKQLIIGTVSTGEMALRLLEDYLKPDLILMDIGLAGSLDGIETA
jgi:CheY-like chemotaxis protein